MTLFMASSCQAFAPSTTAARRTQPLHAETLEGWKIDGMIKPVNNFILIKKAKVEKETQSGIILTKGVRAIL